MADDYPGMGDRNAKAALKIQTLYSAINHFITCFDITSGVTHDAVALPEMIEALSERELFLADLGYFDTNQLKKIGEKISLSVVSRQILNYTKLFPKSTLFMSK